MSNLAKYPWAEWDAPLIALYQNSQACKGDLKRLADELGAPYPQLKRRAVELRQRGIITAYLEVPRWSAAEDDRLERLLLRHSTWDIDLPGRSRGAIQQRAAVIGANHENYYSLRDVSSAIGCCRDTCRTWVEKGLLRAYKRKSRHPRGTRYTVTEPALRDFLLSYPQTWQAFAQPAWGRAWLEGIAGDYQPNHKELDPRIQRGPTEYDRLPGGRLVGRRA